MQALSPKDVQEALAEAELDVDMIFFDESTATSQQAAEQIGCQLGQIVKSIAFMVDGQPVLVLASGDGMVDDRKLAKMFDVGRKKVKIAKPDDLVRVWGYPAGGVPPLGHRTVGIPIYVDSALQRFETVYAAGGAHNAIFGVQLTQLVAKTGGTYADVRKGDS